MRSVLARPVFSGLLLVVLAGCGSGSFVGRRFDNFKAYYNTFYNARRVFDKGYESVERKDAPIDQNYYLSLFVQPGGNSGSRDFEKAIKKSADLLRDHPDSKWVDDALFLIGKSYFYQEAYVGALQKFREVVDLNSGLQDEARFWVARTLAASGDLEQALLNLQESLNREGVKKKWLALYHLTLGEVYVKQSDWSQAAEELESGLQDVGEKEVAGNARFLLGQVYETMGRYEDAAESYRGVSKEKPSYELWFASRYNAIRLEGLHGDSKRALSEVRKMERDDKNYEYLPKLRLLRARVLQASGGADEAFDIYDRLLYDKAPTSNLGTLRGDVHYALGELYRDIDRNFVMAAAHFDTAAASLARPTTRRTKTGTARTEQFAPAAITDINDLKIEFDEFSRVFKEIEKMDSLLWLGRMDQDSFDAKILVLRQQRAKELEEQKKAREARQAEAQFRQSGGTQDLFRDRVLPAGKQIDVPGSSGGRRSGFLFNKNTARVEEGKSSFILKWGDRPLVPNWRRLDAITNAVTQNFDETGDSTTVVTASLSSVLPEIDISSVPRDSLSQAKLESTRALARYDLGNKLFLGLNRPDSAAVWYRLVLDEDGDEPVARRALYALAEVQRALGDSLSANRIYDRILSDYPESDFADRILRQRGTAVDRSEPDSVEIAQADYAALFNRWQSGETDGVIDDLIRMAARYPGTDARARALLAVGRITMENAANDTTLLLAPLDLSVSDSTLQLIWPGKFRVKEKSGGKKTGNAAPNNRADVTRDATGPGIDSTATGSSAAVRMDSVTVNPGALRDSTATDSLQNVVRQDSTSVDFPRDPPGDSLIRDAAAARKDSLNRLIDQFLTGELDPERASLLNRMVTDTLSTGQELDGEPDTAVQDTLPDIGARDTLLKKARQDTARQDTARQDTARQDTARTGAVPEVSRKGDQARTESISDPIQATVLTDSVRTVSRTANRSDSTTVPTNLPIELKIPGRTDNAPAVSDTLARAVDLALQSDSSGTVQDSLNVITHPPVYIEDVYRTVSAEFPSTRFSKLAQVTLKALKTLRTPPAPVSPDTLARAGTRLPSDSTATDLPGRTLTGVDSTSVSPVGPDSTAAYEAVGDDRLTTAGGFTDSLSTEPPATDSLSKNISYSDSLTTDDESVPSLSVESDTVRIVSGNNRVDEESGSGLGASRSVLPAVGELQGLRRLLPNGRVDAGASGWTVIIASAGNRAEAQNTLFSWGKKLDATAVSASIFAGIVNGKARFFIGWGLFESSGKATGEMVRNESLFPVEFRVVPIGLSDSE